MTARERGQRLRFLFERVTEAPSEQRAQELAAAARTDPELADDLAAMCAAAAEPDMLLDSPVPSTASQPAGSLRPAEHMRSGIAPSPDDSPQNRAGVAKVGDLLFGWFRIEAIRSGGFSVVYLCRHVTTNDGLAIKTIQTPPMADPRARQMMVAEAERWAALEPHSNVVSCDKVLFGAVDKRLWLGLELVEGHPVRGTTLREWMDAGPLGVTAIVRVVGGVCEALRHVAAAGLSHCDLKPSNVLMTRDGFAKVADFGLARVVNGDQTGPATGLAGTPAYLSPESWSGLPASATARDVYAFGVMLWELLGGRHPFGERRSDSGTHASVVPDDPRTINPDAPAVLADMALACLTKNPACRPTFDDLHARLRAAWPALIWSERLPDPGSRIGIEAQRIGNLISLGHLEAAEQRLRAIEERVPRHWTIAYERVRLLKALGRMSEAREPLELIAAVESTSPGVLLQKSAALRDLCRHEEALKALDEALVIEPDEGWCLLAKGDVLIALGRGVEARTVLERCSERPTESGVAALLRLADLSSAAGARPAAARSLLKALHLNPNDERALCHLAASLSRLGMHKQALKAARRALQLNPGDTGAHFAEAIALKALGQDDRAEAALRRLADGSPPHFPSCVQLGRLLLKRDAREAMQYLAKAIGLNPWAAPERVLRAQIMATIFEGSREALAMVDDALAHAPGSIDGWLLKGDLLTQLESPERALEAYRQILSLVPNHSQAAVKIEAVQQLVRGHQIFATDPVEALTAYTRAATLDAGNFVYKFARSAALLKLDRPGEALPIIDAGLAMVPRTASTNVRWIKLRCLLALHLVADAQQVAQAMLATVTVEDEKRWLTQFLTREAPAQTREQIANHWYATGLQSQREGRFARAAEFFMRSLYAQPKSPRPLAGLATCYSFLGKTSQSDALLTCAISLFKQSLELRRDPVTLFNYAQCLHMADQWTEALHVAVDLKTLTPDDSHLDRLIEEIRHRLRAVS